MTLKAIIIDDEQPSIDAIKKIIVEFCPTVEIIDSTNSPSQGIQLVNTKKPDILFLDIEMPNLNGFDVLEAIDDKNVNVIFITAYDHYAIKAFKVNAIDYILKPINVKEIIKAVNKVSELRQLKEIKQTKYSNLISSIKSTPGSKIQLATQNGVELVTVSNIIRVLADGRYSKVFLKDGSNIFVTKTLKNIEADINNSTFLRVHKSHLVNMDCVKKYNFVSNYQIELLDGTLIEVSRRKKDEFIEYMTKI